MAENGFDACAWDGLAAMRNDVMTRIIVAITTSIPTVRRNIDRSTSGAAPTASAWTGRTAKVRPCTTRRLSAATNRTSETPTSFQMRSWP